MCNATTLPAAVATVVQEPVSAPPDSVCSVPILLCHASPVVPPIVSLEGDGSYLSRSLQVADDTIFNWLCVNYVCGSFTPWSRYGRSGSISWNIVKIFTSKHATLLFQCLYPEITVNIFGLSPSTDILHHISNTKICGVDIMFIPYLDGLLTIWLSSAFELINSMASSSAVFF